MKKFLKGILYGACLAAMIVVIHHYLAMPSSYKPWIPLDPNIAPGPFTKLQINAVKNDYPACQSALLKTEYDVSFLNDQKRGDCTLPDQVSLQQSLYPYSAAVQTTCPLMAALIMWEEHVVRPAAEKHLESDIAQINHYGIFSCRNVRGSTTRLSQHSTANAIDIAGFQLKNGEAITVLNDWGKNTPAGTFLSDIHQEACALFSGVLGPNYNDLHADHFHFDMGPYRICR